MKRLSLLFLFLALVTPRGSFAFLEVPPFGGLHDAQYRATDFKTAVTIVFPFSAGVTLAILYKYSPALTFGDFLSDYRYARDGFRDAPGALKAVIIALWGTTGLLGAGAAAELFKK